MILEVFVERRYVYDGQKLLANARLKNHKGKLMGRTHVEFTPLETVSESDSGYVMRLAGYIEAICIEDTSIVEHELEKIFFSNTHSLADRTEFAKHFNEFNYQKWITKGSFDSYLLKDVIAGNTQNGVRALVIFENDKAIAVVYGRNIRIKKYEMHVSAPNYNLYILKSGNESYKKAISDTFFRELDTLY